MECKVFLDVGEFAVTDENLRALVLKKCDGFLKVYGSRIVFEQRAGQVDVFFSMGPGSDEIYLGNVQPQYPAEGQNLKNQVYNIAAWLTIEYPDEAGLLKEVD